jgi:hypothetical protein
MKAPYLIQRGTINWPLVHDRLSKAVSFDYMGSAEFEFGALPESLREMQKRIDSVSLTVEPRIMDGESTLRVLHTFTPDEYEEYLGYLLKLREGHIQTKEDPRFQKDHSLRSKRLCCDFWWDIDNHVMWSFDKNFMKRLPDVLVASWKYMNEQKSQ